MLTTLVSALLPLSAQVYEGQVVGVYNKSGDLKINVCKAKALTNMRASQSEKKVRRYLTCYMVLHGVANVLQCAADAGLAVLLRLSSLAVAGEVCIWVQREGLVDLACTNTCWFVHISLVSACSLRSPTCAPARARRRSGGVTWATFS
jgi:hypothetical protein